MAFWSLLVQMHLFCLSIANILNYSSKNKPLSLNFSLKVLYYLVFNKLYAANVSVLSGIYFVFSQNKSESYSLPHI